MAYPADDQPEPAWIEPLKVGDVVCLSGWGKEIYVSCTRGRLVTGVVSSCTRGRLVTGVVSKSGYNGAVYVTPQTDIHDGEPPHQPNHRTNAYWVEPDGDLCYNPNALMRFVAPTPPSFTSIEEADAWLEKHSSS